MTNFNYLLLVTVTIITGCASTGNFRPASLFVANGSTYKVGAHEVSYQKGFSVEIDGVEYKNQKEETANRGEMYLMDGRFVSIELAGGEVPSSDIVESDTLYKLLASEPSRYAHLSVKTTPTLGHNKLDFGLVRVNFPAEAGYVKDISKETKKVIDIYLNEDEHVEGYISNHVVVGISYEYGTFSVDLRGDDAIFRGYITKE